MAATCPYFHHPMEQLQATHLLDHLHSFSWPSSTWSYGEYYFACLKIVCFDLWCLGFCPWLFKTFQGFRRFRGCLLELRFYPGLDAWKYYQGWSSQLVLIERWPLKTQLDLREEMNLSFWHARGFSRFLDPCRMHWVTDYHFDSVVAISESSIHLPQVSDFLIYAKSSPF